MTISRNLSKVGAKVDLNGVVVPVANSVTRDMLSPTAGGTGARNWTLLGKCTLAANGFRTTTVTWVPEFRQLMVEYYIAGYASGAGIGRILVGNGTPADTGTSFCTRLIENCTGPGTASQSVSGWPTALTADSGERYGMMFISNQPTKNKRMTGHGNWGGYSSISHANNRYP